MGQPYLIDPDAGLIYTFDFSAEVPSGVSVASVTITAPSPLTVTGKADDLPNKTSRALLSGAVHGALYQVEAKASLNNGETITLTASFRGWNS